MVLALREVPKALQPLLPPSLPAPAEGEAMGTGLNVCLQRKFSPISLLSPLSNFRIIQMGFVMTPPHSHFLANKGGLLRIHQALIPAGELCSDSGLASSIELLPKVKATLGSGSYTGQDEGKGHFPGSSLGVSETKST